MGDIVQFPRKQEEFGTKVGPDVLDFFGTILKEMLRTKSDSLLITMPNIAQVKGVPADTKLMVVLMGVGDVTFNKEVDSDATS